MGPFETIDPNAPGGVKDYVARYGKMYADLKASGGPVDWSRPVLERIEADRRAALLLRSNSAERVGLARSAADGPGRPQAADGGRYGGLGGPERP